MVGNFYNDKKNYIVIIYISEWQTLSPCGNLVYGQPRRMASDKINHGEWGWVGNSPISLLSSLLPPISIYIKSTTVVLTLFDANFSIEPPNTR